ncbi:MAG: hypothetical protein RMJ18_00445 [Candidatus Aenigmarchaeota archaeon]|nr:hypothetical protein [Candidatus Aenigmarchaeota archaeon]MCX8190881.1 hypothetical protein [Candidatus Aenigmarchaeota archaeon]MDW8159883.1 hypothetical protein [Candidatus Aenigmarchaeota archaeon]
MEELKEETKKKISPEWLLDCVCIEDDGQTLVISPRECFKKGIKNIKITLGRFSSPTVLTYKVSEIYGEKKE